MIDLSVMYSNVTLQDSLSLEAKSTLEVIHEIG
jgi:hypothetical protein